MIKKKRKKRTLLIISFIILLSVIYALADRYLIEHVEIIVQDQVEDAVATAAPESIQYNDAVPTSSPESIQYDDWNYISDEIKISINKVENGSGSDKVTYYAADIKLKDSKSLRSAFAKGAFGRNIIENTSKIASDNNALFAINGDYYGFRGDGVIIRNGILYRDVPERISAAFLQDGSMMIFDEKVISSSDLLQQGVIDTLSFGPVLVDEGKVVSYEGQVVVDPNFGNWPIQDLNPRTGIGMIEPNHFIFIIVDGRMYDYSKGMTLLEFSSLFADLGCTVAYNLDGGGSSTMYFMGRVVNNPLGKQTQRGVSDILYIEN